MKANLVSLYLGEGMVDLPEIKEESSPKPSVSTLASVKVCQTKKFFKWQLAGAGVTTCKLNMLEQKKHNNDIN